MHYYCGVIYLVCNDDSYCHDIFNIVNNNIAFKYVYVSEKSNGIEFYKMVSVGFYKVGWEMMDFVAIIIGELIIMALISVSVAAMISKLREKEQE